MEVTGSHGSEDVRIVNTGETVESVVGIFQGFSEITTTMLKITSMDKYSVHSIRRYVSAWRRKWIKENKNTLSKFLSVCCTLEPLEKNENDAEDEEFSLYEFKYLVTVPLEIYVLVTADSEGRKRWMSVLQELWG